MKKNRFRHYVLCCLGLVILFGSCEEPAVNNDDITRHLELIEVNAKIKTFPLTIVLGEHLTGDSFPSEIKNLSGFSRQYCKTLPIAGLLRLGPNNYYTYNAISELNIPPSVENSEDAITTNIQQQVNDYLHKTVLDNFDSLLTPNREEVNIRALSLSYIHNTSDSVFFYSRSPNAPVSIRIGNRDYGVYTSGMELRRRIDDLVCNGRGAVSVLFDLPIFDIAPGTTASNTNWPTRGRAAGDTCVGTLKFERLHDGTGGFMMGKLLESNSKGCGFVAPTGIAGDTCVAGSRYEKMHDGKGGFRRGKLLERNSRSCGVAFPTGDAGDTCVSGSRYQRVHDGQGGFRLGKLLERNSRDCGYILPQGLLAGDTCVNGSRYQKLHDGQRGFQLGKLIERNSKSCGVTAPERSAPARSTARGTTETGTTQRAITERSTPERSTPERGTTASGYLCYKGSKYAKVHDGRGGFMRGALVEQNSDDCPVDAPDNRCARRSTPLCEQDGGGNYTGRRVQYCYNAKGDIIQTIVIERCDSDCRCIGK